MTLTVYSFLFFLFHSCCAYVDYYDIFQSSFLYASWFSFNGPYICPWWSSDQKLRLKRNMKIKNYRFPCETCGNGEVISSIQVFFRKNGEVSYARARHYGADKKFYYHKQSINYTIQKLEELRSNDQNIDPCQESTSKSIVQVETELSPILKSVAGLGNRFRSISLPDKI